MYLPTPSPSIPTPFYTYSLPYTYPTLVYPPQGYLLPPPREQTDTCENTTCQQLLLLTVNRSINTNCCRCDNTRQCVDGSDEQNCTAGEACADGKYACRTGLNIWGVSLNPIPAWISTTEVDLRGCIRQPIQLLLLFFQFHAFFGKKWPKIGLGVDAACLGYPTSATAQHMCVSNIFFSGRFFLKKEGFDET